MNKLELALAENVCMNSRNIQLQTDQNEQKIQVKFGHIFSKKQNSFENVETCWVAFCFSVVM